MLGVGTERPSLARGENPYAFILTGLLRGQGQPNWNKRRSGAGFKPLADGADVDSFREAMAEH